MTVLSNITTRSGKGSALSHTEMDGNFTTLANAVDGAIGEGNKILFLATSAPTGWTQDTTSTLTNAGLRIKTDDQGGTGGTDDWVSSLTITDGHQLVTSEIPAHTHTHTKVNITGGAGLDFGSGQIIGTIGATTGSTGGDGEHTHDVTWSPKYVDFIVCSKDAYS